MCQKYSFHPHYDGRYEALHASRAKTLLTVYARFADRQLSYEDRKSHLVALVQTYLFSMQDIGAETWLMHGTLMGWWWNRKVAPHVRSPGSSPDMSVDSTLGFRY